MPNLKLSWPVSVVSGEGSLISPSVVMSRPSWLVTSSHSSMGKMRSATSAWNEVIIGCWQMQKSISGNTSYHDFALPSMASLLPDMSNHTRGL